MNPGQKTLLHKQTIVEAFLRQLATPAMYELSKHVCFYMCSTLENDLIHTGMIEWISNINKHIYWLYFILKEFRIKLLVKMFIIETAILVHSHQNLLPIPVKVKLG